MKRKLTHFPGADGERALCRRAIIKVDNASDDPTCERCIRRLLRLRDGKGRAEDLAIFYKPWAWATGWKAAAP